MVLAAHENVFPKQYFFPCRHYNQSHPCQRVLAVNARLKTVEHAVGDSVVNNRLSLGGQIADSLNEKWDLNMRILPMLNKITAVWASSQHANVMRRVVVHVFMMMLMAGCASESPIPPTSERAAGPGHDVHAKYNRPYKVKGKSYQPLLSAAGYRKHGIASWYGDESGELTAMGSRFNPGQLTAAHKTLPLPCRVKVTNTDNGRSLVVTVNDRGPFHKGRLIDLSRAAAKRLGVSGVAEVDVEYLDDRVDGV